MTKVTLPYGKDEVNFEIDEKSYIGKMRPPIAQKCGNPETIIEEAINNPIGSKKLDEIIIPGKKIAIIIDDISRPTPIKTILTILLKKLDSLKVQDSDILIVIALGSHRYMTEKEIEERVGTEIFTRYKIINSEFKKKERLVYVSTTKDGVNLIGTKEVVEADIKIGLGNLVPHPVMGWGGGGKILYPGIASEETVAYFHLIASLYSENMFGQETTPIRDMMETWVDAIGLDFIINVVLTSKMELAGCVAGNYIKAHRQGVEKGKKVLGVPIKEKADVIVVSSFPADQDFWQSPKALYGAEAELKGTEGGTMILLSPNFEGVGPHPEFLDYMGHDTGDQIVKNYIKGIPTSGDPLAIAVGNSMSKMRKRRDLVVVSDGVTKEEMDICGCKYYPLSELQKAVDEALQKKKNSRLAAIANGAEIFLYEEKK